MSRPSLQVVCALVFHGDRLLVTRRDPARAFPLKWEFPGGKLEDGESPEAALHRELEEELQLKVRIIEALEPVRFRDDGNRIDLMPFVCRPDQAHGPRPIDHVEIRWLECAETAHLDWAPADVPLLEQLPELFSRLPH
jgi:8-oxo-dGTP diphosphatase